MANEYVRVVRLIVTGDTAGAIKAMQDLEKKSDSFGTKAEKLGSKITKVGKTLNMISLPLLAVGAYAVKSAVSFQSSMTQIQTMAGASAKELKYLEAGVLSLSTKTGVGSETLAKALYPIRSVGLRGSHALEVLSAAAKGAQISGAGTTEVATALTSVLQSKLKDIHGANDALGAMNGIVNLGKMHLNELAEAMGSGIMPQLERSGVGFRDFGAALDAMTRKGVPANVEATRLKTNLSQIASPSTKAIKALKEIGLAQDALALSMRKNGITGMLGMLQGHLSSLPIVTQQQLIGEIFGGSRGGSNMMGLLAALPEMNKIHSELGGYNAARVNREMKQRERDASFQLQRLGTTAGRALIESGKAIMPVVIQVAKKLAGILSTVAQAFAHLSKPVKTAIVIFGGVLAVAGPLLVVVGKVVSAIGVLANAFKAVNNAFKAVNAAIDIGMMFDPITLGLIAVGVLVLLVVTHFKTFQHVVGAVFGWLRGAVNTVIGFVKAHWPLLLGILTGPFGFLVGYVATHFKQVAKIVRTVFGAVAGFIGKIFDSIVNDVVKAINLVIGAINLIIKGYNSIPSFLRPTGTVKEIGLVKEVGGSAPRGGVGPRPAFAGAGGWDTHRLHVDNKIYIDRRSIGRPVAEAVTEYTARRKARQG